MSLFACTQCGCVENTACCRYAVRKHKGLPLLCSECDPDIGKWHGRFIKRSAEGMLVDNLGHLWSKQNIESNQLPQHLKIVGQVPIKEKDK